MTMRLAKRVEDLERQNGRDEWSFIMVMSSDGTAEGEKEGDPFQATVWGVTGEIYRDAGESMKDFYHRLQVIDLLRKRPEKISAEEKAATLTQLANAGMLKTPKVSNSQSAIHMMEFEDEKAGKQIDETGSRV